MSCLKCRGTPINICHEPKVSDQQLDILRNMIKCLCKCGDAEDNIGGGTDTGGDNTGGDTGGGNSDGGTGDDTGGGTGGGDTGGDTGGEKPTTPTINTEWVVNNVTVGSSCGKYLIQASRTKDNIKVFSDIEVIPDVQQVSNEIIAGNYGTEVNNAVLAIDPETTDWVLDPANNQVVYTIPVDTTIPDPSKTHCYTTSGSCNAESYQSGTAANTANGICEAIFKRHQRTYGEINVEDRGCTDSGTTVTQKTYYKPGNRVMTITAAQFLNPAYDPNAEEGVQKALPIDTVAAKVISDAEACNTTSENRLFNIVMSLAHSGFYNDLFEDNIL